MQRQIEFHEWEYESEIFSETALFTSDEIELHLVVTPLEDGGVEADLLKGPDIIWREWMPTVASAKRAVEMRARKEFLKAA